MPCFNSADKRNNDTSSAERGKPRLFSWVPDSATPRIPAIENPASSGRLLVAVALTSLFCTFAANRSAAYLLPQVPGIGPSCIFAAVVAVVIYLGIRPIRPFGLWHQGVRWNRVLKLSALWLAAWLIPRLVHALIVGKWETYASGIGPVIGFVLFGPIAEELLFRGAIYELSERTFPGSVNAPALISTLLFSAYHLQIHGYHLTPFVAAQMAFVIPLGWVLARVRSLTGSVWPGLLLHIITNIPNVIGPYSRVV